MPKIPSYEATQIPGSPGGAPQFREQQFAPVMSIDQAMAPGKAVGQKIGDALTEFSNRLEKAQQASQYANLSVAATKELHETQLKYHLDTDYGTLTKRYTEEAQGIVSKYLEQATDQEVKNHLTIKLGNDYSSGITSIGNVARKGVVDQLTAETLARYEERKRIAAGQGEFDYQRTVAEQMGDLDGMTKAGVLRAEEAQKMKNKFKQDVDALKINQMKINDPQTTIRNLQDPTKFTNADPAFKQRAIEGAQKTIEILDRRGIAESERRERQLEKDIKLTQASNIAKLMLNNAPKEVVLRALANRQISEEGALKALDRQGRNIDADISFVDKQLDGMFKTKSPFEQLDPKNENYLSSLKREVRDRVFNPDNPELPMNVLDEVLQRERDRITSVKGLGSGGPLDAYPRPKFYAPGLPLDAIKKRTVEAFKAGAMDKNTFELESRKIWMIENKMFYDQEAEKRMKDVKDKTGDKK